MSDTLVYGIAFLLLAYTLYGIYGPTQRTLDAIPTVGGPSGPITSYLGAIRLSKHGFHIFREGYNKFKGTTFKVADLNRWIIVVSGQKLINELQNAPDDVFSFQDAINDVLSVDYTLCLDNAADRQNLYHIPIIRSRLTRNLSSLFPEVYDEIEAAFNDLVVLQGDDWVKLPALQTSMQIVCRASNRMIVGLPLCRNTDFGKITVEFTIGVVTSARLMRLVPKLLKPLVGNLLPLVPRTVARAAQHLKAIIEERLEKTKAYGDDWADKPNDMLTWFLEEAEGEERDLQHWAMRILRVNFSAIHTSSMTFTNALYFLAAAPEYIQPMREEVEVIVKEEGWTKVALQKMRKIDSFLKESQRMTGIGIVSLQRKVLKPYTFSDGTTVPVGVHIVAASECIHTDEENYADAATFSGFRFAQMREEVGQGSKHQLVTTSHDYLLFGHGRHACPGRFFAGTVLKAMFAHLVLHYDVKLENEGVRPAEERSGVSRTPNRTAEVMFRRCQK